MPPVLISTTRTLGWMSGRAKSIFSNPFSNAADVDFDAIRQHEGAQKLSRRNAAMKERFVVCLILPAPDHQLAVLDRDADFVLGEARHRQGDGDAAILAFGSSIL